MAIMVSADSGREGEPHRSNDSLAQTHDSNSSELPDPIRLGDRFDL